LKEISAGGPPPLATYAYDLNGNRITKTLENGTTASYIYDNASQLTRVIHMKSATNIAQFDYTLNAVGNRTAKNASGAIPNVNESYTYDAIDQVTAVSKPGDAQTFAYDPTGNRTAVTSTGSSPGVGSYTTNALNQYTAAAGDVLLYDTKGNLTTQGLSASYSYGSKNRLLGATKGSNLYAYALNNGVNLTDPFGLCPKPGDYNFIGPVQPSTPLPVPLTPTPPRPKPKPGPRGPNGRTFNHGKDAFSGDEAIEAGNHLMATGGALVGIGTLLTFSTGGQPAAPFVVAAGGIVGGIGSITYFGGALSK